MILLIIVLTAVAIAVFVVLLDEWGRRRWQVAEDRHRWLCGRCSGDTVVGMRKLSAAILDFQLALVDAISPAIEQVRAALADFGRRLSV